jgi:hypothetical protein
LDVGFPGGAGNLDLAPLAYRLKDCKSARNSLIGIIRSRNVVGVKGNRSFNLKAKNRYLSPHLWGTIMQWLNEVAFKARECGAVYCMVDGYFFPEKSAWRTFVHWLDGWEIDYRMIFTEGHILGWGSWSMDFRQPTIPYTKGSRGRVNAIRLYAPQETILRFWRDVLDYRLWRYGKCLS